MDLSSFFALLFCFRVFSFSKKRIARICLCLLVERNLMSFKVRERREKRRHSQGNET